MQALGRCARRANVSATTRSRFLQAQLVASPTHVQWIPRRGMFNNPFNWIANKLSPTTTQKEDEASHEVARQKRAEEGKGSLFDAAAAQTEKPTLATPVVPRKKYTEHKYSTAHFKISQRKLNKIGRQIAGKPIDYAILQMKFSEKRVSTRIQSMLNLAKKHAVTYKGLNPEKLIVSEAWVTKGENFHKRIDIKGRGRMGVKVHPEAKMSVVLKEGKTVAELKKQAEDRKLKRIFSAGYVREDVPLRNAGPMWSW
ncbi:ribosomal protein L22 [Thelephora terrestris]|uniref:Ribosomal protein L22 n=1 Tax=Thelephora terrestris TaxID=56493 RepID=A0A9P6L2B9_9AGAM|nr:ribosomal protein L22 [Thelephora terrestris]